MAWYLGLGDIVIGIMIRRARIKVAMVERSNTNADTRTLVILAFSTTAGVLVEFYDFVIYGFAAASAFPSTFFPGLSPTRALVLSYLAFGAGFPARLVGAFIFGHFGDRAGRKTAFVTNILIVAAMMFFINGSIYRWFIAFTAWQPCWHSFFICETRDLKMEDIDQESSLCLQASTEASLDR